MPTVMVASVNKQNGTGILHKNNVARYAVKNGNAAALKEYNITRHTLSGYMKQYKSGSY